GAGREVGGDDRRWRVAAPRRWPRVRRVPDGVAGAVAAVLGLGVGRLGALPGGGRTGGQRRQDVPQEGLPQTRTNDADAEGGQGMDERDHARREIAAARRSMSEIAEELALRSSPAYLKARGKELAASKASQTRDKAMRKVSETRMDLQDSVRDHPSAWSLAGGLVGLGISSLLVRRFKQRDARRIDAGWRRDPSYGFHDGAGADARYGGQYASAGAGSEVRGSPDKVAWAKAAAHDLKEQAHDLKERGSGMAHDLKERGSGMAHDLKERGSGMAHDLKERGREVAHILKERRSSGDDEGASIKERGAELKERDQAMFHEREAQLRDRGARMKRRVEEDPLPVAIGALALGTIAAFLLPVSSREREQIGPLADRVRGRFDNLKGEASSRLEQVREQASESFSSFKEQATETLK